MSLKPVFTSLYQRKREWLTGLVLLSVAAFVIVFFGFSSFSLSAFGGLDDLALEVSQMAAPRDPSGITPVSSPKLEKIENLLNWKATDDSPPPD